MNVLTVNPGSSSLKLAVVDAHDRLVEHTDRTTAVEDASALRDFLRGAPLIDAAAVRLVHGGDILRAATLVDDGLRRRLDSVTGLAPLHNPVALAALDALHDLLPGTPVVVCVDTAFHATIPAAAATYAVPWDWTSEHGVRKYGFHGLSHRYASRRATELLSPAPPGDLRLVTCHLGAGASLAAIAGGISLDTTMGFTPMDGLVMATRAGAVDPGLVTWMQRRGDLTADEIERRLDRESGLLGVSGRSADVRELYAAADAGDERSRLALDVMLHRLATLTGAMVVAAGGLDALVFTGGIGEGSARVRQAVAERLAFLGVALGPTNDADPPPVDADVSTADARVRTLVIHAREDVEMARETRAVLGGQPS